MRGRPSGRAVVDGACGECGIVELVTLMGQYTGLTMLFVVDRYPVPTGAPDEVNKPM